MKTKPFSICCSSIDYFQSGKYLVRHLLIFSETLILSFNHFIGPMFHPEMHGSLAFFRAILNGEKLTRIPNDSMSFIDVRDLAELELAALENTNARGKPFHNMKYGQV